MPDGSSARTHLVPNDEGETGGEMEERDWIKINTHFIEDEDLSFKRDIYYKCTSRKNARNCDGIRKKTKTKIFPWC